MVKMADEIKYITDVKTIQAVGNIPKVTEDKIKIHMSSAKNDMISLIGATNYELLIPPADPGGHDTSSDVPADDIENAMKAEAYFALSYIVPAINIESSGSGITKATGYNNSRQENLSEYDIETIVNRYRDFATRLISKYILKIGPDTKEDIYMGGPFKMVAINSEDEGDDDE
jgi:hypothetical protein